MDTRCILVASLLSGLLASSCVATSERIDGDDGSVFAYGARVRLPLGVRDEADTSRSRGAELRIEASTASGSDEQDLAAGEQIRFEGIFVPGPARVETELEERELVLAIAAELALDEAFTLTPFVGFVFAERELRVDTGVLSASDDARDFGFDLGLELGWRARSAPFRAYAALRAALLLDDGAGANRRAIELGLAWNIDQHAALLLGWRQWNWREEPGLGASDLDYTLSGPVATLEVRW